MLELKKPKHTVMSAVVGADIQSEHNLEKLLNPSSYSKLDKLLRVTAYVRRFVVNIRLNLKGDETSKGPLEETNLAEKSWIKASASFLDKALNI